MGDVTIKFVDFWPTWEEENNKFVEAMKARHNVRVIPSDSEEVPDILFYSRCGKGEHLKYDCLKIYFTGENDFPDFNECDYALSFYDIDFGPRHLRYPLYMLYEYNELSDPVKITDSKAVARPFCSLLMRNSTNCDPLRLKIIDIVDDYKPLVYGGSFRNNTGGNVKEKIPFISGYKFNLALENSIVDGYVTEKILEPMVASTVPVYWGSEYVKKDFNPESFINVNDFQDLNSFMNYLKEIDNDDKKYLEILRAPKLIKGVSPDFDTLLVDFLDNIIKTRKRYCCRYGEMKILHQNHLRCYSVLKNKYLRKIFEYSAPKPYTNQN